MTLSLKHKFTSAIPDAGDPTIVQPSNWNDEHALTQATSTILGRVTAGTGVTEELTPAQARTLLNVANGATANSTDAFLLARANHTGTQSADTLTDGTTNKAFLATERTKLAGIATGATANSTDAFLLARANHTGTQSADTLTDGTTNKAFLATERTKLAGIATGADVTATALNATAKGTPVDADRVYGGDSAASFGMVYATWTQVKAFLKTYFDTLYVKVGTAIVVKKQVFTASGTYTPDAKMLYCDIMCLGAGAGGGGITGVTTDSLGAGGGGAGSISRLVASNATIGASKAVTIGALGAGGAAGNNNGSSGGDTSVGVLCIGKGGTGGLFPVSGQGAGGAGGVAGTGDDTSNGATGTSMSQGSNVLGLGGGGASSPYGGGGRPVAAFSNVQAGGNATGFGAGGSGASAKNSTSTAAGGNGSPGYVVIVEYCSV